MADSRKINQIPPCYQALLTESAKTEDEREVEYRWVWRNLVSEGRILDVGCCESRLAEVLTDLGYEVWGIDLRDYANPPFNFVREDIRRTSFRSAFFDQIIAVSTIEHVGMKAYGNTWIEEVHGDRMAILEMYRILKPSGTILITLPYGASRDHYWIRYYNKDKLEGLLWGLKWEATYYRKVNNQWHECPESEAGKAPSGEGALPQAIVCVRALKFIV